MRREISVTTAGPNARLGMLDRPRRRRLRADLRPGGRVLHPSRTGLRIRPDRPLDQLLPGIGRRDGLRPVQQATSSSSTRTRPRSTRCTSKVPAPTRPSGAALPAQRRRVGLLHRHRDRQHRRRQRRKPLLLARRRPDPRLHARRRRASGLHPERRREVRRRRRQRRAPLDRELQHPRRWKSSNRPAAPRSKPSTSAPPARPAGSGSTSRTTTCTSRSTSGPGSHPLHGGKRIRAGVGPGLRHHHQRDGCDQRDPARRLRRRTPARSRPTTRRRAPCSRPSGKKAAAGSTGSRSMTRPTPSSSRGAAPDRIQEWKGTVVPDAVTGDPTGNSPGLGLGGAGRRR